MLRRRLTIALLTALALLPLALLILQRGTRTAPAPAAATAAAPRGPSPLDAALSPNDRAAFTDTITALGVFMESDAVPFPRARTLANRTCARLDRTQPLTAALADTCAPTIALGAVIVRAARECSDENTRCVAVMRQRADVLSALARSERRLARAVRRTVPAGPCREALAPSHLAVTADLNNSRATRRFAAAIAAGDDDLAEAHHDDMHRWAKIAGAEALYPRAADAARACNLPTTTFGARPPAP